MRDIAVENQTREERAEDALQADDRRQCRTEEHHTYDEDVLHHRIAITTKEITRQTRDEPDGAGTEQSDLHQEEGPEPETCATVEAACQRCNHHQR